MLLVGCHMLLVGVEQEGHGVEGQLGKGEENRLERQTAASVAPAHGLWMCADAVRRAPRAHVVGEIRRLWGLTEVT